jgi:hypothetical protein
VKEDAMTNTIDFEPLAKLFQAREIGADILMRAVVLDMLVDAVTGINRLSQRVVDAAELLAREKEFDFQFDQDDTGRINCVRAVLKAAGTSEG